MVLAEMYSVVIRNATLESKYPGGLEAYSAACPNLTYCTDGELCRIGFMAWTDVEDFLSSLEPLQITPSSGNLAVLRQDKGLVYPCDWAEFGHMEVSPIAGTPTAKLRGSTLDVFVAPPGWKPATGTVLTNVQEMRQKYDFLGTKDGVDSYQDRATGEIIYIGRTAGSPESQPTGKRW